jgi:hypothetical protein
MKSDKILEHYRTELAAMREDIAACEASQQGMHEIRGGERVDVTAEYVAELRQRAANLEKVLRASEKAAV